MNNLNAMRAMMVGVVGLAAGTAQAQLFIQVDGFATGTGSGSANGPGGRASDSVNIHDMFFPSSNSQAANLVTDWGTGYGQIATTGEIDSNVLIRLQGHILAQGSSVCEPNPGCGNGSGAAGVTSHVSFRVSEEAVLFLSATLGAASHIDPGMGGSGSGFGVTTIAVTQTSGGGGTLFGRSISNSSNSNTAETIGESGVARLFPGIDYACTITCSSGGQSFGQLSGGQGSATNITQLRLLPPACPTATAPADVVHCPSLAGTPAAFTTIASGAQPRTVRWQFLDAGTWTDLTDGAVAGVGTVQGSGTASLTISGPGIVPNTFRATVHNDCGNAFSTPASLRICASDFNRDGAVDFFDYLDFLDLFSIADPAADFNQDSVVDFFDYLDFLDVFSTGC